MHPDSLPPDHQRAPSPEIWNTSVVFLSTSCWTAIWSGWTCKVLQFDLLYLSVPWPTPPCLASFCLLPSCLFLSLILIFDISDPALSCSHVFFHLFSSSVLVMTCTGLCIVLCNNPLNINPYSICLRLPLQIINRSLVKHKVLHASS